MRSVEFITRHEAARVVVEHHYLHRRPPMSFAWGLFDDGNLRGVCTYGVPASRHLQKSACPSAPDNVIELNRLWVDDVMPTNSASWFVSRTLKLLPPLIVVSYADTVQGHLGVVYRALNFHYAGWTDMERKTPRYDYIPHDPTKHTREASRSGVATKVRRKPKVKYWTTTGNRAERTALAAVCAWPSMSWANVPPPMAHAMLSEPTDSVTLEATHE